MQSYKIEMAHMLGRCKNRYSIQKSSLTGKKGNDQFITGMLCWIVIFCGSSQETRIPVALGVETSTTSTSTIFGFIVMMRLTFGRSFCGVVFGVSGA